MVTRFHVPGVPAPQGSKTPFGTEANPRTRPWRAAISAEASIAHNGGPVLNEPVAVVANFFFPRPKSHYGTGKNAQMLKDTAPTYHTGHPDLDKLQRALGDALTGTVLRDDKLIASWITTKCYGDPAGVDVVVIPTSQEEEWTPASRLS